MMVCQKKNLPKVFTASSKNGSVHVENFTVTGSDGGIAKLILHPHLVELHHRLVTKGNFWFRLFIIA